MAIDDMDRIMRRYAGCVALGTMAVLAGCSSRTRMERLASQASIDERAPVKARIQLLVHAPQNRVWQLLTDVNGWPAWHSAVSKSQMTGPAAPGQEFTWKVGGTEIHSRMVVVTPGSELVWTGSAMGAHAIHAWRFEPTADGGTLVKMDESMDGLLMKMLYSSKQLTEDDEGWLDDLKTAAENHR